MFDSQFKYLSNNHFQYDKLYQDTLKKVSGTKKRLNPAPIPNERKKRNITHVDDDGETWVTPRPPKTNKTSSQTNLSVDIDNIKPSTTLTNAFDALKNSIDDSAIASTSQETEETTLNNKQCPTATKKSPRPPPIHTYDTNVNQLSSLFVANNITKGTFSIRDYNDKSSTIHAKEKAVFDNIKQLLQDSKIQFFTYTQRDNKPKSLIIKGITGIFTEDYILEEINEHVNDKNKVKKVSKYHYSKKYPQRYFYLVQIQNGSPTKDITNIKQLAYQDIKWDQLRKKKIFQCKNCQRIGHASVNCQMAYRCVKCAGSHGPNKCPLDKNVNKDLLKCANCNQTGHPASYQGCPFISVINKALSDKNKQKKEAINKQNITANSYVTNGKSYADSMRKPTDQKHIQHQQYQPTNQQQYQSLFHHQLQPTSQHQHQHASHQQSQPTNHQESQDKIPDWFANEKNNLNQALTNQFNAIADQFRLMTTQLTSLIQKFEDMTSEITIE